ncbi:major facilitator superfamily domain-containing protein [Tricladium varicosporioides]|nr:major facilitator superfamily domain-containing protein [Hymenoscyphus varicosporioides]
MARTTNDYRGYRDPTVSKRSLGLQTHSSLSSAATLRNSKSNSALDVEVAMAQVFIPEDPTARPKHFRNNFQELIFIFTVMMATAATTFLQGVVVINTAAIGRELKMSDSQVTWIAAAVGGSFMLFFGKTADMFGRKTQLLAGMAFLALLSLITAFAPNAITMDVLCGFLGLGTAIISPPAIGTLFASYVPGPRQNRAAGALGAGNPIGFILGSISSGIATKIFSWRASFIVIAIFFAIMTVAAYWTMPSIPRAGGIRRMVRQFDYLGTVLTIFGVALSSAALTDGPQYGWGSFKVILTLLLGLVCLLGFAAWEKYYTHPLLDPSVWKNTNFTLCVLCVGIGYMSFVTNQFWIPLYMQEIQHLAPLHIAVRMLPQAIAGIGWSYLAPILMQKLSGRVIMGIGGGAYLLGATLLVFIRPESSYWKFLFPAMVFTVVGADFQFIVSNLYVTKQMPTQASLAAGIIQTAYRLSVSVGLAITSAVYGTIKKSPKGHMDLTRAFQKAYICGIIFAAVSILFIPFMKLESTQQTPTSSIRASVHGYPSVVQEAPPRSAGEHSDQSDPQSQHNLGSKGSKSSLGSAATNGSADSYFPRWSWEENRYWPPEGQKSNSYNGEYPEVIYEVCTKCLEERRVILPVKNPVVEGVAGWI